MPTPSYTSSLAFSVFSLSPQIFCGKLNRRKVTWKLLSLLCWRNLPLFLIKLLKFKVEPAGNLGERPSDRSNLEPSKPNSQSSSLWPHLLSQPYYPLERAALNRQNCITKNKSPACVNNLHLSTFSQPDPKNQNQRFVHFGFKTAQVEQQRIQKLDKICRNKKADNELIMYDLKVFYQHLILLWNEGSFEKVVVCL